MANVSTLSILSQSVTQIKNVQSQLSLFTNQLASGKRSEDLGYYSIGESARILDLRSLITKKESFINSIKAIEPQLEIYNSTFERLEDIANDALSLANRSTDLGQISSTAADQQFDAMLEQFEYYLNQKLGTSFIFGGGRFGVQPVGDINALPVPPVETAAVTNPTLPTYDSQAPGSDATAYTENSVKIDDGFNVTYGISSNDEAFQNLILGVRWAYAATQAPDQATFDTRIATARSLIASAGSQLRALHADVASDTAQLQSTKNLHEIFNTNATGQIQDIQSADTAELATKISFAQTQLQASYSVTGRLASLSLVNYL
jgi:flagellin-like hook-associated protein FlgL